MGWSGWEHGEIRIPTKEVPNLRRALNAAHEAHRERVKNEVDKLWAGHLRGMPMSKRGGYVRDTYYRKSPPDGVREDVASDVLGMFQDKQTKPTADTYDRRGLSPANARTRKWRTEYESVTLDGRTVTWHADLGSGYHQNAHDHWLSQALFEFLDHVQWTRGSGGIIAGNNEMNTDDYAAGGGGNYEVATYGPGRRNAHDLAPRPDESAYRPLRARGWY